jgi:hypothetical protein
MAKSLQYAAALYLVANPGSSPADVRDALVSAGSLSWNNSEDPDIIKDPLLDVSGI